MNIDIRLAQDSPSKERLYHFRYQIHTMEMTQDGYDVDHDKQWIYDHADESAIHLYAVHGERIVGCIRININTKQGYEPIIQQLYKSKPLEKIMEPGQIAVTGRFVLDPKYRNQTLASLLISAVNDHLIKQKTLVNFSLCEPNLVQSYHRLGYRQYLNKPRIDGKNLKVPMVLCLKDKKYLMQVMSPFGQELNDSVDDKGKTAHTMASVYPDFEKEANVMNSDLSTFWAELADNYARGIRSRPSLFDGLHQADIKLILSSSTKLSIKAGDTLQFPEKQTIGIGVVVQGKLGDGYKKKDHDHHHWFELFKEGDTFGEPQTSNKYKSGSEVIALENTEVIILASDLIEKLKYKDPILATRLTMNMIAFVQQRVNNLESHLQDTNEEEFDESESMI